MELASANRHYDKLHESRPYHDGTFASWAKEPMNAEGVLTHPYHYRDGVHIWVSPVDFTPDDRFTTDRNAPAVAPHPDPRGGEHGDEA